VQLTRGEVWIDLADSRPISFTKLDPARRIRGGDFSRAAAASGSSRPEGRPHRLGGSRARAGSLAFVPGGRVRSPRGISLQPFPTRPRNAVVPLWCFGDEAFL